MRKKVVPSLILAVLAALSVTWWLSSKYQANDVMTIPLDLSLYIPIAPKWVHGDPDLETLTYINREWNRQQIAFDKSS
nr:hypothetical protein [Chlamydiota bacterium]